MNKIILESIKINPVHLVNPVKKSFANFFATFPDSADNNFSACLPVILIAKETIMAPTIRFIACFVWLGIFSNNLFAQNTTPEKPGTSTVSGKVTIEGKPAPNVTVLLTKNTNNEKELPTSTNTDAGGSYKFEKIRAGRYTVGVTAEGFYNPKKRNEWDSGTDLTITDNDVADEINFGLIRGAVVTGRLFDERGRSVIEQDVVLMKQGADGKKQTIKCNDRSDDRGVYRCYGVEPGKYIVGAGSDPKEGNLQMYQGRQYLRAWYPGVRDEEKATVIDVKIENESVGIDIKLSQRKKGHQALGKVIDAISGKPIPMIMIGTGTVNESGDLGGYTMGGIYSNTDGEFKLSGLTPGKYRALAIKSDNSSDYMGNSVLFEIKDEDVTDLEIKLEKGATITGVARLEEGTAQNPKSNFSALIFSATSTDPTVDKKDWFSNMPSNSGVDAAGNLKFKAVHKGKVNFRINGDTRKEFSIVRVERDGTPISEGLDVKSGEEISGIRIILAQGSATIRGEIKVEGGTLTEDVGLRVKATRTNSEGNDRFSTADARGKFSLEGLTAGSYELSVETYPNKPPYDKPSVTLQKNSKTVQAILSQETSVTLTVSIGSKEVK